MSATRGNDGTDGLSRIAFQPGVLRPPAPVSAFLSDADRRIERFVSSEMKNRIPSFVRSDPFIAWDALSRIRDAALAPGPAFCDWGSGFGVIVGLAAFAGYRAKGIEIEPELVARSRAFLGDHGILAEIHEGSYLPPGAPKGDDPTLAWEPGFAPSDFDLVYAYPWPAEEALLFRTFGRYAREGALLLTFHGGRDLRLHRRAGGVADLRNRGSLLGERGRRRRSHAEGAET